MAVHPELLTVPEIRTGWLVVIVPGGQNLATSSRPVTAIEHVAVACVAMNPLPQKMECWAMAVRVSVMAHASGAGYVPLNAMPAPGNSVSGPTTWVLGAG